jgi:hypothetical protein
MPKGPRGEKRPADVVSAAVMVGRIATGDAEDIHSPAPKRAAGGKKGGKARAASLSTEDRQSIAKRAAAARWGKKGI